MLQVWNLGDEPGAGVDQKAMVRWMLPQYQEGDWEVGMGSGTVKYLIFFHSKTAVAAL